MRAAHVLSHVSNIYAGVPIGTKRMVSALSSLGIGVSLWATGDSAEEKNLSCEGLPAHLFAPCWPAGWRRSPELAKGLEMAAEACDIFHIHEVWNYPQYMAARTGQKKNVPYILAPRASLEPWRMKYKSFKKNMYLNLFGNTLLHKAACLHAVSPAEVDGFRKVGYEGPAFVACNGIVPEEFLYMPDRSEAEVSWPVLKDRRVILFLSRFSPEKGLDEFIPAWSKIVRRASYDDALLVMAGPDDRGYGLTVREMIRKAGIEDRVFLTGMVEGQRKLALMSRADIYVLPSYSEGFSNSLLENMAAGKPVLITPGCNFPEVEKSGAGLCIEPERGALGEALMSLLDLSPSELAAMGCRGRRLVMENYTWSMTARKIATVYRTILRGGEVPLYPEPIPIDPSGKAVLE